MQNIDLMNNFISRENVLFSSKISISRISYTASFIVATVLLFLNKLCFEHKLMLVPSYDVYFSSLHFYNFLETFKVISVSLKSFFYLSRNILYCILFFYFTDSRANRC